MGSDRRLYPLDVVGQVDGLGSWRLRLVSLGHARAVVAGNARICRLAALELDLNVIAHAQAVSRTIALATGDAGLLRATQPD